MKSRPTHADLAAMPNDAQRHWSIWRKRHGAEARVPDDFAAVLDALDLATRGWLVEASKGGSAVRRGTSGQP